MHNNYYYVKSCQTIMFLAFKYFYYKNLQFKGALILECHCIYQIILLTIDCCYQTNQYMQQIIKMNRSVFVTDSKTYQTHRVVSPVFNSNHQNEKSRNSTIYNTPKRQIQSSSIDSDSFPRKAIKRKPIFTKSKTPTHDNTRRVKNVGKSFEFTDCIAGQTAQMKKLQQINGYQFQQVNQHNEPYIVKRVLFQKDSAIYNLSQSKQLKEESSSRPVHTFITNSFANVGNQAKTRYFENNRRVQMHFPLQNPQKRISPQLQKILTITNRPFINNSIQNLNSKHGINDGGYQKNIANLSMIHPSHLQTFGSIRQDPQLEFSKSKSYERSPPKFVCNTQPKLFQSNQLPYIVGDSGPLFDEDLVRKRNLFNTEAFPGNSSKRQNFNFQSPIARQINHSEAIFQMKKIITDLQAKFSKLQNVQQQNNKLRNGVQDRDQELRNKIRQARSKIGSILSKSPNRQMQEQLVEIMQILKMQ